MTTNKRASQYRASLSQIKWTLGLLFIASSIGVALAGYFFYAHEAIVLRRAAYRELESIARMKSNQLKLWRKERTSNARILSEDIHLAGSYERWQMNPDEVVDFFYLRNRLENIKKIYNYQQVLLTTTDGRAILAYPDELSPIDGTVVDLIKKSVSDKEVVFGGFSYNPKDNQIHLTLVAPLLNIYGESVAAVILVINPRYYLYPMLQTCPTSSGSTETMIVQKDNDHVLCLNQLRHREASAMKVRIPLDQVMSPSVQAIYGKNEIFEGIDYRGIRVIAHIQPIEDSNWYMIVKTDSEEAINQASALISKIIISAAIFILIVAALTGVTFHFRRKKLVGIIQLKESRQWLKTALYSVGDGVIVTDTKGHIRQMNPAAEILTGWSEKEVYNTALDQVLQIRDESFEDAALDPVDKALKNRSAFALAHRGIMIDKNESERPISGTGASLCNQYGEAVGVVMVFRDQTEDRKLEKSLQQSLSLVQSFMDSSPAMMYLIDRKGRILMANEKTASLSNHRADDIIGRIREDFLPKPQAKALNAMDMMVLRNKTSRIDVSEFEKATGDKRTFLFFRFPVFDPDGKIAAVGGIATDITNDWDEQKLASIRKKERLSE